ncbi:Phospholipid-transporting ATPase ABCA3 [Pseudolycoriella hygida]|uniref:Phospholipid-transporting ATPase ABCA3 n=1 Tax=Pseudolycoriella hygida TaxID=35572 RepID=A0A9Q0MP95_9DIPT|nr:Phospholipid-transporting ATPase ABCA3 [Pseudolycoriella hygida]
MTTSAWDKFLLLSWKNWIIQIRHPIQTIFEVLVPIFICALLILVRGLVEIKEYNEDTRYQPLSTTIIPNSTWFTIVNRQLIYSPKNDVLERIVSNVSVQLGFNGTVLGVPNSLELLNSAKVYEPFASIEFEDSLQSIVTLPNVINYAIRFPAELRRNQVVANAFFENWATDYKLGSDFSIGPRNRYEDDGGEPPGYIPQGFIALQNLLERQIINEVTPGDIPDVVIQRFPYPPYVEDIIGFVLEFAFPFLFLIAFLYNCINNIKYITIEKELQLKESMKIMGLPSYMHWLAWFSKCMLFQVIIISVLTGMFKIQLAKGLAIFTHSNWFIVWLFFLLYAMSAVTYSFMFSTFFSKANIASIVGAIMWFVLLIPYNLIGQNNNAGLGAQLASSLLCNSGMGFGFQVMSKYETAGVGVQWENLFSPVSPDSDLTLGAIMLVLLIASVIQMVIALYVEKIKPGEFGVAEKFYFPFTLRFWTGKVKASEIDHDSLYESNSDFEAEPKGLTAGIQVRGLRKVYDNKVAVNHLTLNMYEDQITVLLGHNGAGKSTTMSMLTGLFRPTSGTAFIKGKDIRTEMNAVRSSLGMCPQHNVLFNELTVKEHIIFFSKLKGMKKRSDIDEQIRKYVNLLELTPKLNAQSKTLSGGMKRKLSVGIALCGNSQIVMCDEPTSGMDPAARRALWDILIQEKKGRTILLTTHFMDEADVLGDRIAIMADGDLKTVGSSFFLKKKFGVGYRLICEKDVGCDTNRVTHLLSKYIPDITAETDIGTELTYVLKEDYVSQFRTIFADLEASSVDLNVTSFGVSLTTMEEVFLKVGTDTHALSESSHDNFSLQANDDNDKLTKNGLNFVTGIQLQWSQITAMINKKFLYAIRNYILLFLQFFIPALFIVITMLTEQFNSGDKDLPELSISFNEYLGTVTTVERDSLSSGSLTEIIATNYEQIINNLSDAHTFTVTSRNFEDQILDQYRISLSTTNLKYMVGVTFNDTSIKAWFNNQAYHTAPLAINTINNAILKTVSGNAARVMNLVNKPLPYSQDSKIEQLYIGNNAGFNVAFNTTFAMAFVTAMFVVFYIKERVSRAKLLQFVSGVNKVIFWGTSFVIDYVIYILISLLLIFVLAAYQQDAFSTFEELGRNFAILVLFGFAVFPFTYICSFMFHVPSTGLVRLSIGYIVSGVFTYMAFFILNNETLGLRHIAEPLGWVFLIFPHYSLARGINNLYMKQSTINICNTQCSYFPECSFFGVETICNAISYDCDGDVSDPTIRLVCNLKKSCCDPHFFGFDESGIGIQLVALFVIGVVSFFILFAMEFRWIQNFYFRLRSLKRVTNIPESEDGTVDSDVMAEKNKIRSLTPYIEANNNLIVKDFTKFYGNILAVNQICVGVNKSECFGLLGVNGAGKTSMFKMLTGDETITSGEAWVDGISVKTNMDRVHQRIGYCPQFDALLDDLTGRETLKIFALLRGIPSSEIAAVSNQLAEEFSFTKHLDKRIKAYSGGNKRKLSTALSMLGNPSVIYLDEPTSGMDVGARRQLWNMVIKARNAGKSIVLTSHSMEECEVLCTRLAIMVNGEFKCLGSTQHLKNKFSKGFFLTIKINRDVASSDQPIEEVKHFVTSNFTDAILKEQYMDMLTYHIPTTNIRWSQMFGLMEDAKQRLSISDYSLGQTSLEQVFLFFTKYQRINNF